MQVGNLDVLHRLGGKRLVEPILRAISDYPRRPTRLPAASACSCSSTAIICRFFVAADGCRSPSGPPSVAVSLSCWCGVCGLELLVEGLPPHRMLRKNTCRKKRRCDATLGPYQALRFVPEPT